MNNFPLMAGLDLSKSFSSQVIFENFSFDVYAGEVIGIVGENGTGKSTLLKCLLGLLPYSGIVTFRGNPINHFGIRKRIKLGIRYLPQTASALMRETVQTNLKMAIEVLVKANEQRTTNFDFCVQNFELSDLLKKKVYKLSGGERRRLEIALTLLGDTSCHVIVLDEPFHSLDENWKKQIWEIFRGKLKNNSAVIIAEHSKQQTRNFDRIFRL